MLTKQQCLEISKNVKMNKTEICKDCNKSINRKNLLVLVNAINGNYHFTCKPCWHSKYNKPQ